MIPKFRAWDKIDNKLWDVKTLFFAQMGRLMFLDLIDYEEEIGKDIIPEHVVLMQSTGLPDQNGVEGYLDDIIKTGNGRIWQIKHGTFFWHVPKDVIELYGFYLQPIPNLDNHPIPIHENFGEIIGNVHTHPELLAGDGR